VKQCLSWLGSNCAVANLFMRSNVLSKLFEGTFINGMPLANRFVRFATWEGMATDDGEVTPPLIDTLTTIARGGVGLIISSHCYISPTGQGTPWQLGVYKDELVDGLKELTSAVHDHGGRIVMQLAHAGAFAEVSLTVQPALAVSKGDGPADAGTVEIDGRQIDKIIADVAAAAGRARRAGYPGASSGQALAGREPAQGGMCLGQSLLCPGLCRQGGYCVTKERGEKKDGGEVESAYS